MRKHLSEPWFSLVCTGKKKYEGRLADNEAFSGAPVGSEVTWYNDDLPFERVCRVKITEKTVYAGFAEMLLDKGVERVLPTVSSVKDGVAVYRRFYPGRKPVLCLRMKVLERAPGAGTKA